MSTSMLEIAANITSRILTLQSMLLSRRKTLAGLIRDGVDYREYEPVKNEIESMNQEIELLGVCDKFYLEKTKE